MLRHWTVPALVAGLLTASTVLIKTLDLRTAAHQPAWSSPSWSQLHLDGFNAFFSSLHSTAVLASVLFYAALAGSCVSLAHHWPNLTASRGTRPSHPPATVPWPLVACATGLALLTVVGETVVIRAVASFCAALSRRADLVCCLTLVWTHVSHGVALSLDIKRRPSVLLEPVYLVIIFAVSVVVAVVASPAASAAAKALSRLRHAQRPGPPCCVGVDTLVIMSNQAIEKAGRIVIGDSVFGQTGDSVPVNGSQRNFGPLLKVTMRTPGAREVSSAISHEQSFLCASHHVLKVHGSRTPCMPDPIITSPTSRHFFVFRWQMADLPQSTRRPGMPRNALKWTSTKFGWNENLRGSRAEAKSLAESHRDDRIAEGMWDVAMEEHPNNRVWRLTWKTSRKAKLLQEDSFPWTAANHWRTLPYRTRQQAEQAAQACLDHALLDPLPVWEPTAAEYLAFSSYYKKEAGILRIARNESSLDPVAPPSINYRQVIRTAYQRHGLPLRDAITEEEAAWLAGIHGADGLQNRAVFFVSGNDTTLRPEFRRLARKLHLTYDERRSSSANMFTIVLLKPRRRYEEDEDDDVAEYFGAQGSAGRRGNILLDIFRALGYAQSRTFKKDWSSRFIDGLLGQRRSVVLKWMAGTLDGDGSVETTREPDCDQPKHYILEQAYGTQAGAILPSSRNHYKVVEICSRICGRLGMESHMTIYPNTGILPNGRRRAAGSQKIRITIRPRTSGTLLSIPCLRLEAVCDCPPKLTKAGRPFKVTQPLDANSQPLQGEYISFTLARGRDIWVDGFVSTRA